MIGARQEPPVFVPWYLRRCQDAATATVAASASLATLTTTTANYPLLGRRLLLLHLLLVHVFIFFPLACSPHPPLHPPPMSGRFVRASKYRMSPPLSAPVRIDTR